MSSEVVLAEAYDWMGLYVDGALVNEGHSIPVAEALRVIAFLEAPICVLTRRVHEDWMMDQGSLPINIIDVVWVGQKYAPASRPHPSDDEYFER